MSALPIITIGLRTVLALFGIGLCIQIVFTLMRFIATAVKRETLDVTFVNIKALVFRRDFDRND